MPPVLAEHGHRLIGALVGLLTLGLAVWTWFADDRPWLRRLALGALALVILQGVLGGLRVVWISPSLAVVHALTAQLFFALIAGLALFTSRSWDHLPGSITPNGRALDRIRVLGPAAAAAVYVQIILGALLRHPGTGIDPTLALLHIAWAVIAAVAVLSHALNARRVFGDDPAARVIPRTLISLIVVQVALGFIAWFVLLDERGMLRPSNLQVIVNSLHLVTGAALFSANVLAVLSFRRALNTRERLSVQPA